MSSLKLYETDTSLTLAAADSDLDLNAPDSHAVCASSGDQISPGPAPAVNSWCLHSTAGSVSQVDATWQPYSTITFKAVDVNDGSEHFYEERTGQSAVAMRCFGLVVGHTYKLWWRIDTGGSYAGWDDTAWHPAITGTGEQCEWTQPSRTDPPIERQS